MVDPMAYYIVMLSFDDTKIAQIELKARTSLEAIVKATRLVKADNPQASKINTILCTRGIEV